MMCFLLTGCFYGSEFADRDEIEAAASSCGVKNFKVTEDDHIAYLEIASPNAAADTQCVAEKLKAKGKLLAGGQPE